MCVIYFKKQYFSKYIILYFQKAVLNHLIKIQPRFKSQLLLSIEKLTAKFSDFEVNYKTVSGTRTYIYILEKALVFLVSFSHCMFEMYLENE